MNEINGSQPLISVIIPVYNGQEYLEKNIKSVWEQTYKNLQLIIVDDGSTDKTPEICKALSLKDKRIQIIHMEDLGVSAARNAGIAAAEGDYITFLDADDRLMPHMIEILYETLMQTESDIAGCNFYMWDTEEYWSRILAGAEKNKLPMEKQSIKIYTNTEFIEQGILNQDTRCWSKLYKRSCIENVGFRTEFTIGEDMLFLVDLLPLIKKIAVMDYKGYGYFQNCAGAMNRTFKPSYMDQISCWEAAEMELLSRDQLEETQKNRIREKLVSTELISLMLILNKIALLSKKDRKKQFKYICQCKQKIQEKKQIKGAFVLLDKGYQFKIRLFLMMPRFYLALCHLHGRKKWKKN